jgi:beta-galactosidase
MLIIDGTTATLDNYSESTIKACLQSGGKVLILGVAPGTLKQLNRILFYPLSLINRNATSFIVQHSDALLASLENKDFYFTEMTKQPVMRYGLSGEFVKHGKVLVSACNTDWSRWNSRPEYLKTASVYRSEREEKKGGAAIVKLGLNQGSVYITSIDLMVLKPETEDLIKTLFSNLGVVLKAIPVNQLQALSATGDLERAMALKGNEVSVKEITTTGNQDFARQYESEDYSVVIQANMDGFVNLGTLIQEDKQTEGEKNIYLSFWVNSPRSLVDLLVEPDMPKLDMEVDGDQNIKMWINGSPFLTENQAKKNTKFENLPLNKGWNHILLQLNIETNTHELNTRVHFESNKNEFVNQLNSLVER